MAGTRGATQGAVTSHGNRTAQRAPGARAGALVALLLGAGLFQASLATRAQAQARELGAPFAPPTGREGVALDLHAGTLAPFFVGGGARVSLPGQLVIGVLFGGVPDGYAQVFGDAADAFGASPGLSQLVRRFFDGALALRVEVGVRPVAQQGFELLAHYTALISEPLISSAAIDEIAGQALPWNGMSSLRINGVLHGFGGEIGWAFVPFDGAVLRIGVGLTYFAGAAVRLGVPQSWRSGSTVVADVERSMEGTFRTYGIVPYASVLAGIRLE